MRRAQFIDQFGGRVIAFRPEFAAISGGVIPGLFLSQAFYWQKIKGVGKWWWKTQDEWHDETALTRRQQETARKKLVKAKILEEKRLGVPAKLHYRIVVGVVMTRLGIEPSDPEDDVSLETSSMAESAKLDCTKAPNKNGGKRQTYLHHKSTSETTSDMASLRSTEATSTAGGEAGEGTGREEVGEELPLEIRAAGAAGLGCSRVTPEERQTLESKEISLEGGQVGRRRSRKSEAKLQNEEADADFRASAAEGTVVDEGPHPSMWKPGATAAFSEWSDWAAGWITNSKQDEKRTGRRTRAPEAWTGGDLHTYLGHLVENYMNQRTPVVNKKIRGQARTLIAQVGGDDTKKMIDYAVENWASFASMYQISSPIPRIGILLGFADDILGLMDGKGGKVGGSHRDRTKWVDDDNVVVDWGGES